MKRSEERRWIVKIMYQHNFNSIEDVESTLKDFELEEYSFIKESINSILDNLDFIDKKAEEHINKKGFNSIPAIDKAILRVAINEFYLQKNVPISVSINEAVEIAKEYSDADTFKFINGVLSSIAKEMEYNEKSNNS